MIELYTTDNCNYCNKAKNILNSLKVQFKTYSVGKDVSRDFIVEKFPNAKSYPVVVINGEFVGGYNELEMRVYEERNNFGKTLLVES
jgi:glutaredoxin